MTTQSQPMKELLMYAATTTTTHKHNGDHGVSHMREATGVGHEDLSAAAPRSPELRRRTGRKAWLILALIAMGAAGAAAAGTWPRLRVPAALVETSRRIDQGRRSVTVVSPSRANPLAEVRLPGSTSALQETVI